MDDTVIAWLHSEAEHAYELGMCIADYVHAKSYTLDGTARYEMHLAWCHARDKANGWVLN